MSEYACSICPYVSDKKSNIKKKIYIIKRLSHIKATLETSISTTHATIKSSAFEPTSSGLFSQKNKKARKRYVELSKMKAISGSN